MPAPEAQANPYRYDPYKDFKFRVRWRGRYVAGFRTVSGLSSDTDRVAHRPGGDPSRPRGVPRRSDYEPITLARGVTHDEEFDGWADQLRTSTNSARISLGPDPAPSLGAYLKDDLVLHLFNEAGQLAAAWNFYRCWVSQYVAMREPDGMGNAVEIQALTLDTERWERDTSVGDPAEPTLESPGNRP